MWEFCLSPGLLSDEDGTTPTLYSRRWGWGPHLLPHQNDFSSVFIGGLQSLFTQVCLQWELMQRSLCQPLCWTLQTLGQWGTMFDFRLVGDTYRKLSTNHSNAKVGGVQSSRRIRWIMVSSPRGHNNVLKGKDIWARSWRVSGWIDERSFLRRGGVGEPKALRHANANASHQAGLIKWLEHRLPRKVNAMFMIL